MVSDKYVTSPPTTVIRTPILLPKTILLKIHQAPPPTTSSSTEHAPLKSVKYYMPQIDLAHLWQRLRISQRSGESHVLHSCRGVYMETGHCGYSDDNAHLKVDVNRSKAKFENLQQQNCWTKCTAAPLPGVWHQVWFGRALSKDFTQCKTRNS